MRRHQLSKVFSIKETRRKLPIQNCFITRLVHPLTTSAGFRIVEGLSDTNEQALNQMQYILIVHQTSNNKRKSRITPIDIQLNHKSIRMRQRLCLYILLSWLQLFCRNILVKTKHETKLFVVDTGLSWLRWWRPICSKILVFNLKRMFVKKNPKPFHGVFFPYDIETLTSFNSWHQNAVGDSFPVEQHYLNF